MKFSFAWLKELIPLETSAEKLAAHLLQLGFEVEAIDTLGPKFSGVVVGEVIEVAPHPNADRLKLCRVSDGKETFEVVCGAQNVAAGQRVPFARIGAKLPGGFKIKKSKIRGAVSHGMICSADELGFGNGKKADGIHVLPGDAKIGTDFAETLGGADTVLDVDITPNRPDCLSHLGLARELAVYFGLPLSKKPAAASPNSDGPASFPIETADPKECTRYLGTMVSGVVIGPSPSWLVERVEAIGLRPINNLVDITNIILHGTGHPLHAFDADKINGGKIVVRDAKPGEKILALDGKTYELAPENLVIADAKRPVAIAGVMGGEETGVTETTTRLFLECAHFRPGRIRRSAKRLGLRTDSSYRFERGVDALGLPEASNEALTLILKLCGGKAGPPSDTNPDPAPRPPIAFTAERINTILGTSFPEDKISKILGRIGPIEGGELMPPSYRLDLGTANDLAEEVGRHLGYGQIPYTSSPVRLPEPSFLPLEERLESLRRGLIGLGFHEAVNYDFVSQTEIDRFYPENAPTPPALRNPVSEEWAVLRPSMLIGLLRNAALNFNRGAAGLRFFETGRTFARTQKGVRERTELAGLLAGPFPGSPHWARASEEPDLFAVKGVVESLLRAESPELRTCSSPDRAFHPKACLDVFVSGRKVGAAGLLHPDLLRRWELDVEAAAFVLDAEELSRREAGGRGFKPFSVFPSSSRDLSILMKEEVAYVEIEGCLRGAKILELVKIELVDLFTGKGVPKGSKSLTLRLTFARSDRTLRDEEVAAHVDALLKALKSKGAELRG
ncbi:MAG: phenylalanine--tRNA ligase subunit beta [Elusimicrobiota bacterium]